MKKEKKSASTQETALVKCSSTIKRRWLISKTNTVILITLMIAVVIAINLGMSLLKLTPIDCTANKEYTLTEESKKRVANIEKEIILYCNGYKEEDPPIILARQYNKANKNIKIEMIDLNDRKDLVDKYDISATVSLFVIEDKEKAEKGEKGKVISGSTLTTYDSNYETIDVAEEKLTSGILEVASDKKPNVYFLTSFSDFGLEANGRMEYLAQFLEDEVINAETLDILVKGGIPEDCDTLVITTPTKDFDELTTNELEKYINNGGNILWFNSAYDKKLDLPNVNKILALYGIDPFEEGFVYETDNNNTVLGYAGCFMQRLGATEIDQNLSDAVLLNPTKININRDKFEELGIEEQPLINTSETTYYRKDVSNQSTDPGDDEKGGFEVAAIITKTIKDESEEEKKENEENKEENSENEENKEENNENEDNKENEESSEENKEEEEEGKKSKLVIYGDNNFVSDIQLVSNINPMVYIGHNVDLALNSVAYLTEQEEDITIRKKHTQGVSFTATDGQKAVILRIIYIVPIAIIILGIIVWNIRRRKL